MPCGAPGELDMKGRRVFIACLVTETNTSSNIPTSRVNFERCCFARGREAVLEQPMLQGQFGPLDRLLQAKGAQIIYGPCAFTQPSAPIVESEYAYLREMLLEDLRNAGPFDAVFLSLHGAMMAQETWDCEGDILARARAIVGPRTAIVSVMDPHAHLTEQMIASASVIAFMKEYPHTDGLERWRDMVAVVERMWAGEVRPTGAVVDCQILGFWPTQESPIRELTDLFYQAEREPGVVSTSFVHGFPWGDTPETGSKVLVYTNDDIELAHSIASRLASEVIKRREASQPRSISIDAALDAVAERKGLVVLADWADNPGGGAPSDASFILARALQRGMRSMAFGLFYDPQLVEFCFAAGAGARIEGRIGGKLGRYSGEPIDFSGTVRNVKHDAVQQVFASSTDRMGDAACIDIQGIDVVVTSVRTQCYDPSAFGALGVDIRGLDGVVVKSSNHFHHGFAPLAGRIECVNTDGALTSDFRRIDYTRLTKPRWPRDLRL